MRFLKSTRSARHQLKSQRFEKQNKESFRDGPEIAFVDANRKNSDSHTLSRPSAQPSFRGPLLWFLS